MTSTEATEDFVHLGNMVSDDYMDQKAMILVESESGEEVKGSKKIQISDDDIIAINAGGRMIQATRRTLCLAEGSKFSDMFSGDQDDALNRDKGKYYLDVIRFKLILLFVI